MWRARGGVRGVACASVGMRVGVRAHLVPLCLLAESLLHHIGDAGKHFGLGGIGVHLCEHVAKGGIEQGTEDLPRSRR